jgi:quercetin dioxygenase-like cupin family protein
MMIKKRSSNFHSLIWCSIAAVFTLPAYAFAGDAKFLNVFDKSKMKEVVPNTMVSKIEGRHIGAEAWLVVGGTAPFNKGKSHHHPEEHFWMQMAGDATHYAVEFNDGKVHEYDGDAGLVMHMPPGQQHTGGHGKEDAYMVTVTKPLGITTVAARSTDVETKDHYDTFDFDDAALTVSEKDWVYTRKGKLGAGLGEEAVLIKKATKKDYIVSARKAPAEEVAIVYKGHVKVTGCGESRVLGPGDLFYCPGALMYTGLGKEDARVVRVFTPADASSFVSKY